MDEDELEAARQRAIGDACLGDASGFGRLGLYRRLIQGNLATVARRLLPRTAAALPDFDAWFARFLAEEAPRTPYLRDVPAEFVAWAAPLWRDDAGVAPFVGDLARYEMDRFHVESSAPLGSPPLVDVALSRPLVFAGARRFARYDYSVHEGDRPAFASVALLHYRDEDNNVGAVHVTPPWDTILPSLLDGATLGDALALAPTVDATRLAEWLAHLGEARALLGGRG